MSTRLAAVASFDDQRPAGPVYRSIIAVDLEGSTTRTDPVKGELRRVMYDLLERCLETVGVTGNRLERMADRGDGVLVLIRPHDAVPKTVLLDRLVPLLASGLAEHNVQAADPALRMRLRAVLHAGEVNVDSRGFYGEAIDVAIRLLDARQVKRTLKQSAAPLVLVVSDDIYFGIVCHGYGDPGGYLPLVHVNVMNRRHRGWVQVPALAPVTAAAAVPAPGRPSGAPRAPASASTGEGAEHRVPAVIGRTRGDMAGSAAS